MSPDSLFTTLAHDTRLRCLLLLLDNDELCVCELTHAIGAAQPHMSRHLGLLREVGLVKGRRDGLWIYYRVNPDLPEWVLRVLQETASGVKAAEPYYRDAEALEAMPDRPGSLHCA